MSNHEAKVVRINEILKHPNADRLELIIVGGFQVVAGKGQFKIGDLAIYIPPDSIVPERSNFSFVWEKDGGGNPRELVQGDPVPEKYRRVTVRRLRKEWSEGLLMPVSDFPELWDDMPARDTDAIMISKAVVGDDVSEILNITHWNPPEDQEDREPSNKQSRTRPKSLKGWYFFLQNWALRILSLGLYNPWGNCGGANEKAPKNTPPIYDVENFKHHKDVFHAETTVGDLTLAAETVVVTEKIHGSNGRFVFQDDLIGKGHMYAGSRKLWKSESSTNVWRKVLATNPAIELWCRANPGYVLYGEVVPTQGGFEYGATKEEPHLFLFDVRTPDGRWLDHEEARALTSHYAIDWVPVLYHGAYDYEKVCQYVDGKSTVSGANHIREGVVIKTVPERHVHGLGRAQLKIVSNAYLLKEQ